MPTKSELLAAEVAALLRARNPLLWIVTREEARVESYLFESAAAAGFVPRTWDAAAGVLEMNGKKPSREIGGTDLGATLEEIRRRAELDYGTFTRDCWILRDLPPWLQGIGGAVTVRQLRNLARNLPSVVQEKAQALIVISPSGEVPPELSNHATVVEWPLPDRNEIAELLDASIPLEKEPKLPGGEREPMFEQYLPDGARDAAVDAAIGLSGEEAQACFAKSIVQLKMVDPRAVASEKKRVITREKVMEWFDPLPGGLAAVGGLENLKGWLTLRSVAYTPDAREYGLPTPKGVFLVGVQGCGKSLTAKAIATAWGIPLLKMDLGALKSKFMGESEGNLRKAFKVIEALGRCVVWLDEIEKALAGAASGAADGGVAADALGAILTWMQERKTEAFIIATSNNVEDLPPELFRKGRFDDMFFIDLPSEPERCGILAAALVANRRKSETIAGIDISAVAKRTNTWTGSEIAELVPTAMFTAFTDRKRELTTADLLDAAEDVVPLSRTAAEKIEKLREWQKEKGARPASLSYKPVNLAPQRTGRVLDI